MSSYTLLALLLLAVAVSPAAKECKPHPPYTQHSLSLSWPGDFCGKAGNCISAYEHEWDGKTFGIHGLWPSYDSKDLTCITNGKNPDPFCSYRYFFNQNLINYLNKRLNVYWPQWGANNFNSFHKNQWNKHGVCYLKLLKERFPLNKYTDDQLFKGYFQTALKLAQSHNKVTKFTFQNKAELAKELRIADQKTFYVACRANFIFEVRLCYTISALGKETSVKCYNKDLQFQSKKCKFPLSLKKKVVRR